MTKYFLRTRFAGSVTLSTSVNDQEKLSGQVGDQAGNNPLRLDKHGVVVAVRPATVRSNIRRSNILVTAHKHISLALYHHLSLKHLSNKLGVLQSPCRTVQEQISIYSTRYLTRG